MAMLRVMVPPVSAAGWSERPEVARYRREVRQRLEREEAARRAALRAAGPVVARRPEPLDYAPVPPSVWGEPRLPEPWRRDEERPAELSANDYAPFPVSPWDRVRKVAPEGGQPTDPVRRREVADLGFAPFPRSPWER
jgi:hypothetical protein